MICHFAVTVVIYIPGGGYHVGDILRPIAGTLCPGAPGSGDRFRIEVDSVDSVGSVTSVSLLSGAGYTVPPPNPVAFEPSPTGAGFQANLTYEDVTFAAPQAATKIELASSGAIKLTTDRRVQLLPEELPCTRTLPADCDSYYTGFIGPGSFTGCSATCGSVTYCAFEFDTYVTFQGEVDDDLSINGDIFEEGMYPFYPPTWDMCYSNAGKNGSHSFSYTGVLLAGFPLLIETINNFSGTCRTYGDLSFSRCAGPSRIAIYVGNENSVTDDDFEVHLNGVTIATLRDLYPICPGPGFACRGFLVLPTGAGTPDVVGIDGNCFGVQMDLQYIYSPALNTVLAGINHIELVSIANNQCGNFGIMKVYEVHPDLSLGEVLCTVEYGDAYNSMYACLV